MRASRAQGRPGTAVVPPNWGASHAPVAAKTMTLPISLRHPGSTTSTYDPSLGFTPATPHAPYTPAGLMARVQARLESARDQVAEQAEESLRRAGYLITLPLDCAPDEIAVGDLADFPSDCAEPALAGRTLLIVEIGRGSLRFERDLFGVLTDAAETVTT